MAIQNGRGNRDHRIAPKGGAVLPRCRRSIAWRLGALLVLLTPGCSTIRPGPGIAPSNEAVGSPVQPATYVVELDPDAADASLHARAVRTFYRLPEMISKAMEPSNDRDWEPDMARLAYAEFDGDRVTIRNVRNAEYRTPHDYTLDYYDKTFDLGKLRSVDFILVPFLSSTDLAHQMMSFGIDDQWYVCLSVEIRREKGEKYATLNGFLRQYELMYVLADERDLVRQCAEVYRNGVYVYPARLTSEEARALFVDVLERANQLAVRPEFYNTLTNNCTTNLVRHLNRLPERRVPYNHMVLFPGHFDRLLYELGLIDNDASLAEARRRARVNQLTYLHTDNPDFSQAIRRSAGETAVSLRSSR